MPPLLFHFSAEYTLHTFRMPEFESLCKIFKVTSVTTDYVPGDSYPFVLVRGMTEDLAKQFASREFLLKFLSFFSFLSQFLSIGRLLMSGRMHQHLKKLLHSHPVWTKIPITLILFLLHIHYVFYSSSVFSTRNLMFVKVTPSKYSMIAMVPSQYLPLKEKPNYLIPYSRV